MGNKFPCLFVAAERRWRFNRGGAAAPPYHAMVLKYVVETSQNSSIGKLAIPLNIHCP
jgi:hypothetical protein